jgi:hypothetical protein
MTKTFSLAGKRIETRLFMRHGDGSWAGYSYEWNDAQTEALLLPGAKTKSIGDRNWTFPSRTDCMRCHTAAAGFTLGLELGQLNGDFTYPSTGRTKNQLTTLEHIGMFASALPASPPAYPAIRRRRTGRRARAFVSSRELLQLPSAGRRRRTLDDGPALHDVVRIDEHVQCAASRRRGLRQCIEPPRAPRFAERIDRLAAHAHARWPTNAPARVRQGR